MRFKHCRTVLLAVILACCGSGAREWFVRTAGHRPNVPDSRDLWRYWRSRIADRDAQAVVLLGTSRMQCDVSIATMESSLPGHRVVQLAVEGPSSSIGVLQDLARDESFCGLVICETDVPLLERSRWRALESYWTYDPPSRLKWWETLARDWVEDKFVGLQPAFTLRARLCHFLGDGSPPRREYARMRFTREEQLDFACVAGQESRRRAAAGLLRARYQANAVPRFEAVRKDIPKVDELVQAIERRGGRVVFVRMPSFGDYWEIEEQYHPKSDWDRFTSMTVATCIHFRDVPEMRRLSSPDESHLDVRDAPRFTRSLVSELRRRGAVK